MDLDNLEFDFDEDAVACAIANGDDCTVCEG